MKFDFWEKFFNFFQSLPSRGAWIEIIGRAPPSGRTWRRSPHGERGLKSKYSRYFDSHNCRSPHGERGLKYLNVIKHRNTPCRSPHGERGLKYLPDQPVRHPSRRSPHGERGLKSRRRKQQSERNESLPSRGAWIEMEKVSQSDPPPGVAPLTGSVD